MFSKTNLLAVALSLGCCLSAEAKTLYVAPSGNDGVTYAANSATSPWRTIGRAAWGSNSYASPNAAQAAQPGDTVLISAGTYWENGNSAGSRFTVSLNPANSGISGSPITFRGVGLVYVRMNSGFRGGMIGCSSKNFVIWDNFQIDDYYGGSTPDTGPVVFYNSNYCQVINSDIKGHPGSYYHGYATFGGNYRGVSLEPARFTTVKNNRIYNFSGDQNECAVMAYDSDDNIIEGNTIYNNGCGIFIKGAHAPQVQARNVVRNNLLYGNTNAGIRVLTGVDTFVYQNIVINSNQEGSTGLWAGFANSTRSRFVNNTVYNVRSGMVAQGTDLIDVRFHNNIIVNSATSAITDWTVSNPSQYDVQWDRNLYFNNTRLWYSQSGTSLTLAQFQGYGKDTNGVQANPLFVDAANGNFRLQAGSPARALGRDYLNLSGQGVGAVIPAGAYITGSEVIGSTTTPAAPSPPTPPPSSALPAPANLR